MISLEINQARRVLRTRHLYSWCWLVQVWFLAIPEKETSVALLSHYGVLKSRG
ncbi:uncharacterized protein METZ01_LOCUS26277 [marine metagenome]|uniref:Uncharacterized protein n=1 Tax=marine metagenome TaxID=408172 RepID=A0A381Q738_9ZZZZ